MSNIYLAPSTVAPTAGTPGIRFGNIFIPIAKPVNNTVMLMHFDETDAQFADASAHRHPLTNSGATYNTNGKFSGCGTFNGAASLSCPGDDAFYFGTGDWTAETWFKTADSNPHRMLINQRISQSDNGSWSLRSGGIYYNGGGHVDLWHNQSFADGNWHHIAAVRSGTSIIIFFDGALSGTGNVAASQTFGFSDKNVTIGNEPAVGSDNNFTGDMDEIRISNTARYTADFTPPAAPFTGKG